MTVRNRSDRVDWEDLRVFLALAEEGTLSAAARRLKVNHATVSRRTARLEETLGLTLFDRRAEGFTLTRDGESVRDRAAAMDDAANAIARRGDTEEMAGGIVRVTCTRALADLWLVGVLARFGATRPEIEVEIIAESRRVSIGRREADVAIRLARPAEGDFLCRKAATLAYGFVATPALASRIAAGEEPALIAHLPDTLDIPEAIWLERFGAGRRTALRTNSPLAQAAAARDGIGVALVPAFVAKAVPELVPVDLGEEPPPRDAWILARTDVARIARVRAVIDHLVSAFAADRALFSGDERRAEEPAAQAVA